MSKDTTKVIWNNPYNDGKRYPLGSEDFLAACCGARVVNNPTPRLKFIHPGKGIRVFVGKHGKETDTGKTYLSHVETSAGPLTITIKYDE